jgi:hypothetical protein
MNFFGISLPKFSLRHVPPTPQGAPTRLGHWRLIAISVPAVPLTTVAFASSFSSIYVAIGLLGIAGAFVAVPLRLWRYYDLVGWYERHEVVIPELPFETRRFGESVVFGHEGVIFSNLLQEDRTILYDQILGVQIDCQGSCLFGVTIRLAHHNYYNDKTTPGYIPDYGNGERTRTALAILRTKATHATFSGPQWIEEGWVPRLGFIPPRRTIGRP